MWPGKIPKGKVSDELIMAHDLMATLCDLTGQSLPADQGKDSYNILPLLLDNPGAKGRDLMIGQGGMGPAIAKLYIRKDDWKLVINSDMRHSVGEPLALFNLRENPLEDESGNFINNPEHQAKVTELYELYKHLRTSGERTTEALNAVK
jgi:arylsulfatase A-like enzyme